jgi:negative regulator of flagellin synthesis FlgM
MMMQIRGTSNVQTPTQVNFNSKVQSTDTSAQATRFDTTDQVEISSEAQMLTGMNDASSVRSERVNAIRQQIAMGQYETADKLEVAMERLLDELA